MMDYLRVAWLAWNRFWFSVQDLKGFSLFRMLLATSLFFLYCIRHLDLELFFYNQGLMPSHQVTEFVEEFFRSPYPFYFAEDIANLWAHRIFLVSLLLLALGVGGRLVSILALFLHIGFLQRNYSIIYGADFVSTFWLFYLCIGDHSRFFSVLNFWPSRQERVRSRPVRIWDSMAVRLVQVQLCVIYAFTGWEKLKGTSWWEGTAVWRVVGNPQLAPFDMSFLAQVPWVIAALSYTTVLFEIYFPVMVYLPRWRRFWLGIGVFFHSTTAALMGLHFFALVMMSSYAVFLTRADWDELKGWWKLRFGLRPGARRLQRP